MSVTIIARMADNNGVEFESVRMTIRQAKALVNYAVDVEYYAAAFLLHYCNGECTINYSAHCGGTSDEVIKEQCRFVQETVKRHYDQRTGYKTL